MGDKIKAFWVGLFIIIAIALLAWLVMFLRPSVGDGLVHLHVRFSNIDKISKGTRVTYAGKPIGEVVAITEVKDPHHAPADSSGNLYIYELLLDVDSSVQIYSYDEIIYATSGLLGEKNIAILPKATPPGAPTAQNITKDTLYGKSSDKVEQTLNTLCTVADTLEETMQEVTCFIRSNRTDFNLALNSFTKASHQLESFMERACVTDVAGKMASASDRLTIAADRTEHFFEAIEATHLLERLGESFGGLGDLTQRLAFGEGSLSRLINSENFYVQFTTVLCQLRSILDDINHYGVLYQFDRKWKRAQQRRSCTEIPCQSYCE